MRLPRSVWVLVALPLSACRGECPPHAERRDDGLCYVLPSTDPAPGPDSGVDGVDTGPTVTWGEVPDGCPVEPSPHDDPLVEVGSYFLQEDLFAEGTDIELDGGVAWLAGQGGVWSVDISDPANPTYLGTPETGGHRWYNVLPGPGDALYVTSRDTGFGVVDRSDPAQPKMVDQRFGEGLAGMALAGDRLYVASLSGSLVTYDVSTPLDPVQIHELTGLGNAWAVKVLGSRAYVADNSRGLLVIDLADADRPALVGSFETAGGAQDLALAEGGAAVYVATGGAGVETFSLADPDAPESVGTINVSYAVISVAVGGDTLWATNQQDVVAIDISSPTAPTLVNTQQTRQWSMHVAADAERAWVADWGYITSFERLEGASAPDADLSTGQVFLSGDGGTATFSLRNLGGAELALRGVSSTDDRLSVEAESLTVAPEGEALIRVGWAGGDALDATLCFATDDPDEPTMSVAVRGNQDGNPALGTAAPDFTLTGLDGQTYTLSEQQGRPVFLAYFATW